mgnify:CR=1 FL=1
MSGEAYFIQEESGFWHVREPEDPADWFLGNLTYIVVDLETTGYPVPEEGVTEIGAVKVQGDRWVEEFHSLVNPGRYVPVAVQRLAGISNTLLRSLRPDTHRVWAAPKRRQLPRLNMPLEA